MASTMELGDKLFTESSNIKRIKFHANPDYTQPRLPENYTGILTVEFHSGGIYDYRDVPGEVFIDFVSAESAGRFFHHHIRDQYEYKQLSSIKEKYS